MSQDKIQKYNRKLMDRLSLYLNLQPDFINENMIDELVSECHLDKKEAFSILLADICGLDTIDNMEDRQLYDNYFPYMIHNLDVKKYKNNPYYNNIKIPPVKIGKWELKEDKYKPYEGFVFNDLEEKEDGRLIPQIGFFDVEFHFPVVLENNREWMLITPNEIETMEKAVKKAKGEVLTYGLGLGYYAYMVSQKEDVTSLAIVEKDENVINLFVKYILPQFENKNKITIIKEDAFKYAKDQMHKAIYDFVFVDIWHDPSDGVDMYLKMKKYENKDSETKYMYWIEKTISCYL